MKYFLWLIRIVVGVLFIFSGLVKANDPMGLVYKMIEFFEALHMEFLANYAFYFSIIMIAFEIICGFAVLLGSSFRMFSILLVLLNLLFLFITAFALFSGKVKECGCFGACIKISNDATFYKDIALTVLAIVLYIYRRRVTPVFSKYIMSATMITVTFLAFGVQWWALEHLPFNDCLAYKPGNNLWEKMQMPKGPGIVNDSFVTVMTYEKEGVKKEFTTQNYPWQDSTWKFVTSESKLVRQGNAEPEIKDFTFTDTGRGDHTQEVLTATGYTFLWFVKDPDHARKDNFNKLKDIIAAAKKLNIHFYILSSGTPKQNADLVKNWQLEDVTVYALDGTVSKTAMRTNPGLMLIKDSVVQHKWSFRDYPENISMNNGQLSYQ